VTAVEAEPGQVVAAGTPVLRIAADGVRDVVFSVPEDKLAGIRVGAPVKIRLWAQATELPGRVREVAASSDPVTRTYPVKVSIDAKEAPALGATVYVLPQQAGSAGAAVIKLPTTALFQMGQSTAVWLLDPASMTVKAQVIELAAVDGNEVIVAAGLQPGMRVVSAGAHVLSAGQKVSIYQSNMPVAHTGRAQVAPDLIAKPGVAAPVTNAASVAK
jgi:RND family efflux transporter MFP subunit